MEEKLPRERPETTWEDQTRKDREMRGGNLE